MNYCAPCRRHLNGALVCPGCGTPVAGRPDPSPEDAGAAASTETPETGSSRTGSDFFFEAENGGRRASRRAGRNAGRGRRGGSRAAAHGHGRRARRGRGRRITVLALVLGSGLAVLGVAELGAPGMPWQEPVSAVSGPPGDRTKTADESAGAKKRESAPEDDAPSATPSASEKDPASSAPPKADDPAPAPTTVRPTTHAPAPQPTQTRPPKSDPPRTCFLLWCRN